ncbi:hypothetical protein AVEN_245877-1 [Araneus ventricosus]|uniref:Uncharacterized protein n=1 Tax=Araneus ventricosus TaxID=182803 RepID=A0A4Y2HMF1_ARAVE|nr:hypothetical protein AVEN_245877-1 [Araneus ventricosus]
MSSMVVCHPPPFSNEIEKTLLFCSLSMGEKLVDKEVDEIFTACCPPEDEDGYIKYETFVKTILAGPHPESK